MKLAVF